MGFCQKQKLQYGDFIFISQLLNDMKYVFYWNIEKTVITSFSLLRRLDGGLIVFRPFKNGAFCWGYTVFSAQPLLPVLSLSIVIVSLFNIYV